MIVEVVQGMSTHGVKTKILIGYGVVSALLALVVALAVMNLMALGKATAAILNENYRSIIAAENMVDALERQDSGVLFVFLRDEEKGIAQFRENEAVFLEWFARAKDNITIAGEAELIQAIDAGYTAYRRQFSALTDLRTETKSLHNADYQETVYPLFAKVRESCIALRNLNEETMYQASVKAGRVARRAIWSTVLMAASALVVALLFSLALAERIVRPIRRFMEASKKISGGEYSVQVPVETDDELGRLANQFNQMAAQLGRYDEMNIEQIVAEKKKGEAILSSIDEGVVVFDTALRMTDVNPAARRMLNPSLTENTAAGCADILPQSPVCDVIGKTVETGTPPDIPDEERIVTVAGKNRTRHYLFSVTAVRGRDHILLGVVLLLKDITRLKEVERLKSEFVMAASHELRTPLTSLGMSVDLLLEHSAHRLDLQDRSLLTAAHEEVQRMKALIDNLLDLSKIEAGRIELGFETVSVATLFDHAKTVFKNQLGIKAVALRSQIASDLPDVRADANKITWVLTNLISNALRYVHQGGQIQLTAQKAGPQVRLAVKDDGPGIPLEYQSKIFQKFVQVKGREDSGSGLGLAICREIVRAHGGAIWVESSHGHGSTFTFTLPVAK